MFTKEMDFKRLIALSQWDRIVITLIITCLTPFVFHALPFLAGQELGMRWLPMFYAPLIASLCFRPHVSLIVGICAPLINHGIFGMPAGRLLPGLVCELVILNAILVVMNARQHVRAWHVVAIFILVRSLSVWMFSGMGEAFSSQISRSLLMAWPGVVLLAVLAEIVGRFVRRNNP